MQLGAGLGAGPGCVGVYGLGEVGLRFWVLMSCRGVRRGSREVWGKDAEFRPFSGFRV